MEIKPWPEVIKVLSSEGISISAPTTSAAFSRYSFNCRHDSKHFSDLVQLTAALDGAGSAEKKKFWSLYNRFEDDLASLLGPSVAKPGALSTPYWQGLAAAQRDEAFLSRKQLDAIRAEVVTEWKLRLADPAIFAGIQSAFEQIGPTGPSDFEDLVHDYSFAPPDLTDEERLRIASAIRHAVETRKRRIRRFAFGRNGSSLARTDAIRVDIHAYRVRTGISPPAMDPSWTTASSIQAPDPFIEEDYHVSVRRSADRRHLQRTAQERCAGERRKPSRPTDRHPARSHDAGGVPICGTRTHRKAPENRPTRLQLQH